jgi:hypothetical protein
MIEPVAPDEFLITFLSAAAVILSGAGYAALFAWGRLRRRHAFMIAAYACYGVLAGAVALLADAANLQGNWRILTGLMLVGYLLAPHGIWRLCATTHPVRHQPHDNARPD